MSRISVFVHKVDLEKRLAEAITNYLKQNNNKSILFLVSGGSALKVLDYIDPTKLGKNVTVSFIDDRFSRDPLVNNFFQLTRTKFFEITKARGVIFVSSSPEEGESLGTTASRWEKELRQWRSTSSADRIIIATMGVGLDGHTAGIMPFSENPQKFTNLFEDKEKWIISYDAGDKNKYPLRLTVNLSFLQTMIDQAFVYVSGENKKNILQTILASNQLAKYPASVFHLMKRVELYTDINVKN